MAPDAHRLVSPLLEEAGFRHAFFTRRGGVSTGPYESLNFSLGVGDREENVRENLARAARALDVATGRIFFLSQVHGADVHVLAGDESHDEILHRRGDALIGASPDAACAVRIADCAPILLADRRTGAVAAVHAGWRGTVAGVVASAIRTLRESAGESADLMAAIGPHISLEAFEVGEDVARQLAAASPDADVVDRSRAKPHVDLRRILRSQLRAQGLERDSIDDVPGCTVLDEDLLFSYRRDGKKSGRHLAAIVPRG